ncbi:hypothetical protein Tco_1092354 [Tanacetum coccineum]|uniref:Uncharacterized protein n=1 Tax=Tanacetum coccineum TaxID=301880 RepID=A0ABQ5IAU6_9ASTR
MNNSIQASCGYSLASVFGTNEVPPQGLSRGIVSGEYGNCMLADDVRGVSVIWDSGNSMIHSQMVLDFENFVVRLPGDELRLVQVEGCNDQALFGYNVVRAYIFSHCWLEEKLHHVFKSLKRRRGRSRKTPNSGVAINGITQENSCRQGVTESYIDIGDYDCVCEHCGASFWLKKTVKAVARFLDRVNRALGTGLIGKRVGNVLQQKTEAIRCFGTSIVVEETGSTVRDDGGDR